MALTQGFKNLLIVVAIVGVVGGGAVYTHKHNYFGMADAKPKAEAAVPEIPAAPAEPTQQIQIPVTQPSQDPEPQPEPAPQPKHKHKHEQVQAPQEEPVPTQSGRTDSSINALKGMNSL